MPPYLAHHHTIYYTKSHYNYYPPTNHTPHPPCRQCSGHYRAWLCLRVCKPSDAFVVTVTPASTSSCVGLTGSAVCSSWCSVCCCFNSSRRHCTEFRRYWSIVESQDRARHWLSFACGVRGNQEEISTRWPDLRHFPYILTASCLLFPIICLLFMMKKLLKLNWILTTVEFFKSVFRWKYLHK